MCYQPIHANGWRTISRAPHPCVTCIRSWRGFFRYACPCHSCSGEFDISTYVAELAAKADKPQRNRNLKLSCSGQRALDINERVACPIGASIRVSATQRTPE
jgi:hypothetical protein